MTLDFKAAIQARPAGETTAQLVAAYGDPHGPGARETGGGNFEPSPAWAAANLVRVPVSSLPGWPAYPGVVVKTVTLHRLVAPVLLATWAEVVRRGLASKLKTYNGAFVGRHMGHDPARPLSVHAFGAAIDLDAAWNGYGVPIERMQIDRDVVQVFEECGWTWGGRWTGAYADGMHFQWTDPLGGTKLAEWQDRAERVTLPPPIPTVPAKPAPEAPVILPLKNAPGYDRFRLMKNEKGDLFGFAVEIGRKL